MLELGTICRLQVQRASLKGGAWAHEFYDPTGIVEVPALRVESGGVVGLEARQEILDVHHAAHPQSKNRAGTNGISLNVTGNYVAMEARFGAQLTLGIAGENIIVCYDGALRPQATRNALLIRTNGGCEVRLTDAVPAAPCLPYSRFVLGGDPFVPADMIQETLQFLGDGMRGYYVRAAGTPTVIQTGDTVYLV